MRQEGGLGSGSGNLGQVSVGHWVRHSPTSIATRPYQDNLRAKVGHSIPDHAQRDAAPLRDPRQTYDKKIPSTMVVVEQGFGDGPAAGWDGAKSRPMHGFEPDRRGGIGRSWGFPVLGKQNRTLHVSFLLSGSRDNHFPPLPPFPRTCKTG